MTAVNSLLWVAILTGASGVLAADLAPGMPNPLGPAAKYIGANMFTTKAYQDEAFRLVLQEANQVAKELQLPEKLPIADADLVGRFINPFGYARVKKAIGNVSTRNYAYYVSQGNKFSYLEGTHQDEDCRRFQRLYTWPASQIDTNQAYHLATQWLAAVSMDVGALNRECSVVVRPERDYVHPPQGKFVPVYYVYWRKAGTDGGGAADVRVFTPTKTLLQLRVEDPKYILRAPLLFTNLQYLLSQTNAALVPSMRRGGYLGKTGNGDYKPFYFNQALMTTDIEFSEEMFLVTKETADAYLKAKAASEPPAAPPKLGEPAQPPKPETPQPGTAKQPEPKRPEQLTFSTTAWTGEVPPQKRMNFYTKVLSKFAAARGLKLKLTVEVSPEGGLSKQKIEETKSALRELGLTDEIDSQ